MPQAVGPSSGLIQFPVRTESVLLPLLLALASLTQSIPDSLETAWQRAEGLDRARLMTEHAGVLRGSDPARADSLLRESVIIATAGGDSSLVALALTYAGNLRYFEGDFEDAQVLYLRAFQAAETVGDGAGVAYALNELGTLYKRQGDLDAALRYFEEGRAAAAGVGDTMQVANSMNNIGIVHDVRGEWQTAMELFEESAQLKREIGDLNGLTYNLDNMGITSSKLGEFVEAEAYFNEAATLRREQGDHRGYGIILNNIGEMLLAKGDPLASRAAFEQALEIARETRFTDFERHVLGQIGVTYEESGDYRSALEQFRLQQAFSDSLFTAERSRQILEMREMFDTERREQTIALQNAELEAQEAALQRNYLVLGLLVVILGLVMAVGLWRQTRARLRLEEVRARASSESQDQERSRIASDLHDSLGQMITTARLQFERSQPIKPDTFKEMYREMRRIAFNLMPVSLLKGDLSAALQELTGHLSESSRLDIDLQIDLTPGVLEPAQRIAVFRIVQEWMSNVLRHGAAEQVWIQVAIDEDGLVLAIEDDGPGFDISRLGSGSGHGWHNIQARSKTLFGTVRVESTLGRPGSTLMLNAPLRVDAEIAA